MYPKAIRILSKGYVPIPLLPTSKLQEILGRIKKAIQTTNPANYIVIKRLHLYYKMKLYTFGNDKDKNLIIQFPVSVQQYTQQPLILYQVETAPVPIVDQNKHAHSCTPLQIYRPYFALNSEMYISIRQEELRTCKKIGYEFYCEEMFVVKSKSKYSCKHEIYFNLGPDIIKENCKFAYYFNKTDITLMALDGGNEIILANWPDDTHIICNVNNDIQIKIMNNPYMLVNSSLLCNCGIEVENNFLLKFLAACYDVESK